MQTSDAEAVIASGAEKSAGAQSCVPCNAGWKRRKRVLWLVLPAVVAGLLLRLVLLWYMPEAFAHDDTRTVVAASNMLLKKHTIDRNGKKTFLAPALYSIPRASGRPMLEWIAFGQHALGLLMVLMIAFLASLWYRHSALWILPLTLILALHPVLLWFEHVALPESLTLLGIIMVLVTGTVYQRKPCGRTLTGLLLALLFLAGSRPEGKLWGALVLALVLRACWGNRKALLKYGLVALIAVTGIFVLTRTGQSGLLLFTSLVHMTPDKLECAPGLAESMRPIRDDVKAEWDVLPARVVRVRKDVADVAEQYVQSEQKISPEEARSAADRLLKKAAFEIALKNWYRLPGLALRKLVGTSNDIPSEGFGQDWVYSAQELVLFERDGSRAGSWDEADEMYGHKFETVDTFRDYLEDRYRLPEPNWLAGYHDYFAHALTEWKLPLPLGDDKRLPGLPWLWLLGGAGLCALALRERPWGNAIQLGVVMILGMAFIILVAANVKPRFRLFLEPVWFIGLFGLLDCIVGALWQKLGALRAKKRLAATEATPQPDESNEGVAGKV